MSEEKGMEYITICKKKDGQIIQQVVNRGAHLCENIYVSARALGTITSDEDLPEGDCPPVHEYGHVGNSE